MLSTDVKPSTQPSVGTSWLMPSLLAAFVVVMMVTLSGLFFAFPCRWLAENGKWACPVTAGLLFLVTLGSLITINFADPGTLHRGSFEEDPKVCYVAQVNQRAFCLQWCAKCSFHCPPGTVHCPHCNLCVEDFDHHSRWLNNCVGQRNRHIYLLLLGFLFLYLGAVLVTCLTFFLRTRDLPMSLDKAMTILVAVPAIGALVPLIWRLVIQVAAVSTARRPFASQDQFHQADNPYNQGCENNWYFTLCAPLGPKYMSEAVTFQREDGTDWEPAEALSSPRYTPAHHPTDLPGPNSNYGLGYKCAGPPGSGEAAAI